MNTWSASAPSNIALIKYMGKTDPRFNLPTNGSISLALDHLRTAVEISVSTENVDKWEPLNSEFSLSEKGRDRFLKHFSNLKQEFGLTGNFVVRSGNNFPSDCGLASSASSFAALTLATYEVAKNLVQADYMLGELAQLSRKGSGSSCRSFFTPWSEWRGDSVEEVTELPADLLHVAVVVNEEIKEVSSSQAHLKVLTSELFKGRVERADLRLDQLKQSLKTGNWKESFEICWAEFWDMHALFETSTPSFGYMTPGSLNVLRMTKQLWRENDDGPIVTMDAGANVHLIFRADQKEMAESFSGQLNHQYKTHCSF